MKNLLTQPCKRPSTRIKRLRKKSLPWYKTCYMSLLILPLLFMLGYGIKHAILPVIQKVQAQEVSIVSPIPTNVLNRTIRANLPTPKRLPSPTVLPTVTPTPTPGPIAVTASQKPILPTLGTQREQVQEYIREVFGSDSIKAFKLLSCENSSMNPEQVNTYGNYPAGSRDIGVFMINEYWQQVNAKFLFNYKINVLIAKQLYSENGNSFKLWTCGRRLGI